MGKRTKLLTAVKKVFSSKSQEEQNNKKRRKWKACCSKGFDESSVSDDPAVPPPPPIPAQDVKLPINGQDQSQHARSVALASAVAAEAAAVAAQAAAEVVRLTNSAKFSDPSKEGLAAIKIQTAFRGHLARRALQSLRGLVRLKSLIEGDNFKRQTTNTIHCTQKMARIQSEIHIRRKQMLEQKQASQKLLQIKREKELEKLRLGEEWDVSTQSKEKLEADLVSKQEAAIRRERAMAYAFSHQWKTGSRVVKSTFADPSNPNWGWSWTERWMAARPWESRNVTDKEVGSETASTKSAVRPLDRHSPSTPASKASSTVGRKTKPASPRGGWKTPDDDSRSVLSMNSERHRRYCLTASSARDDESLASSSSVRSYMASTESTKARSRLQSPLVKRAESPNKSPASAKKRLSFTAAEKVSISPSQPRRHSGPPKIDVNTLKKDLPTHPQA
ncbi:protein IQ-DOMAIN 1-like [Dioscorea cayenensis subsp. rotundata]|uniref:Protein IQ-DOMAIN 1-like n=1 Tax=Dioscorea cayennensis subsp. rotundata TaxID=55577 RepID=A0AB40C0G9_DIOCR|nr:protein IQ-DOMAIN 1-like [Dioscorea cayenensis subsp. rotundata]XP_039132562.1 protein IQ-DOMAIN 1-like [Dioscorea cayenensis subsp. rotundata]XP_039132563.1 protein IQ-DOMAIN 1-like [Dioscorea cayenensis subsp. rotundata]